MGSAEKLQLITCTLVVSRERATSSTHMSNAETSRALCATTELCAVWVKDVCGGTMRQQSL